MDFIEIWDRVLALPAKEKRFAQFSRLISQAERELSEAKRLHEKYQRGVEKLESESFSSFLFRLVGKYEDKLEERQQEEINAKLHYDKAKLHLNSLIEEQGELRKLINNLLIEKGNLDAEIVARRRRIQSLPSAQCDEYTSLEADYAVLVGQVSEIDEALVIINKVISTANHALDALESAEGWATWDLLGGGMLTHIAKYSHLDEAEEIFNCLDHYLRELREELSDVYCMHDLSLDGLAVISDSQRAIDFWFDNIFTDWAVKDKVSHNVEEVQHIISSVQGIRNRLQIKKTGLLEAKQVNRDREKRYLLK